MASPEGPPPDGGDQDRGPYLVAILWVLTAIDVLFVATRFVGRRLIRSTGWDDWIMLFTLVLFFVHNGILSFDALHGGQRHLYYLSPDEISEALRFNWLAQPFMIIGFAMGKISVGLLLLRYNGTVAWRKWLIYFAMSSAFVFAALNIILTYAQCDKVEALWKPQLIEEGEAHCWPTQVQTDFAIFLGSWNAVIDALLALLPVTVFWSVSMTVRQKLALCVLLGLGLIAAVCSAVKTGYLATLNQRSDFTWVTYDLFVWSVAELFVIIACGSVPPMKPLWDVYFRRARVKMTQYHGGATKEYGSTNLYGSYYGDGSTNQTTSTWDRSTVNETRSHDRSRSYRSDVNTSRIGGSPGMSNDATRFDIDNATLDTTKDPEADAAHHDSLVNDALSRVEAWKRDRAFPMGPMSSHSSYSRPRPSRGPSARSTQDSQGSQSGLVSNQQQQPEIRVHSPQPPSRSYGPLSPGAAPATTTTAMPTTNVPVGYGFHPPRPRTTRFARGDSNERLVSQYSARVRIPRLVAPRADSATLPIPYEGNDGPHEKGSF